MDKISAQRIVDTAVELANRLDESVKEVMAVATDRQAFDYRRLAGRMMAFLVTNLVQPVLRHYPELEPESFKGPHVPRTDPPLDDRVAQDVRRLLLDVKRTAESFRFQRWSKERDAEEFQEGIDELIVTVQKATAFIDKNSRPAAGTEGPDDDLSQKY